MQKEIRQPGPDHPIRLEPTRGRVIVRRAGAIIADSTNALAMYECDYPVVQYIPRADVNMSALQRSNHATY